MYPIKVRKVLRNDEDTSFEFSPVEVVNFKGAWKNFINERNTDSGQKRVIDYDNLEALIRGELEAIVLVEIKKPNVKVAELEIDTGDFIIYVTTIRGIERYSDCRDVFKSTSMSPPEDTIEEFDFSWINRIDSITSVTIRKRIAK